jgi:16S rRNA (guanine1207-N2)-methyltransferase
MLTQSLSNPSKLLQRNESLFAGRKLLVAGNITDSYTTTLAELSATSTFCYNNYRYFAQNERKNNLQAESESVFTANFKNENDQAFDLLLIFIPKAKKETQYILANLTPYLSDNAHIVLVGEKACGIKSASSLLTPYCSQVNSLDSARHCSLLFGQLTKKVAAFDQKQWIKEYDLKINDTILKINTLPGVFSYGELDTGTHLLLNNMPEKMQGSLLDFGCGAGVIACYLKQKHTDLQVDLIDISAFALASAELTFTKNKLEGNVFASDILSCVDKKYNHIVSNPPFHSGKKTDYSATETLIEKSPDFLKKSGSLTLVANHFLKYEPLLNKTFSVVTTKDETTKFKILIAK